MTATAERSVSRARTGTFATLQRIHDACEEIALDELGLDIYPNQIEVITAEQMLDAYSSVGMPLYLQALVVRQAFCLSGGLLPQGADGPRV